MTLAVLASAAAAEGVRRPLRSRSQVRCDCGRRWPKSQARVLQPRGSLNRAPPSLGEAVVLLAYHRRRNRRTHPANGVVGIQRGTPQGQWPAAAAARTVSVFAIAHVGFRDSDQPEVDQQVVFDSPSMASLRVTGGERDGGFTLSADFDHRRGPRPSHGCLGLRHGRVNKEIVLAKVRTWRRLRASCRSRSRRGLLTCTGSVPAIRSCLKRLATSSACCLRTHDHQPSSTGRRS